MPLSRKPRGRKTGKVEEDGSFRVGKFRVYDADTGKIRKRNKPKRKGSYDA